MSTLKKENFPKSERLRKQEEFKSLFKNGNKLYSKFLCIFYRKGTGKVGIVVGKKVSKNATERNLIKRRLRHIYRTNKEVFRNLDTVLIALPSSLMATYRELLEDVTKNIKKISLGND